MPRHALAVVVGVLAYLFFLHVSGCREQEREKCPLPEKPPQQEEQLLVKAQLKPMKTSPELECAGVDFQQHQYLWCVGGCGSTTCGGLAPMDYAQRCPEFPVLPVLPACPPCTCTCSQPLTVDSSRLEAEESL